MKKIFTLMVAILATMTIDAQTKMTCKEAADAALAGKTDDVEIEGYVTVIQNAFNAQYGNISVWLADTKDGGKVIELYRAVCASANEAPAVGDKIKAQGKLTKYNKTPELGEKCTYTLLEHNTTPVEVKEMTCADAAKAAAEGSTAAVKVKGYVTGIAAAWSEAHKDVSLWVADTKDGGKVFQLYQAACEKAEDVPAVGEFVEAEGNLTYYSKNKISELAKGCTFKVVVPTAIASVKAQAKKAMKFIQNGKLVIENNGRQYNVAGALVK